MRSIWALAQGIGPSKASSWCPGWSQGKGAITKRRGHPSPLTNHSQVQFHPIPSVRPHLTAVPQSEGQTAAEGAMPGTSSAICPSIIPLVTSDWREFRPVPRSLLDRRTVAFASMTLLAAGGSGYLLHHLREI